MCVFAVTLRLRPLLTMPSRETVTGRQRLRRPLPAPPGLDIHSVTGSSAEWPPTVSHDIATLPHTDALRHDSLSLANWRWIFSFWLWFMQRSVCRAGVWIFFSCLQTWRSVSFSILCEAALDCLCCRKNTNINMMVMAIICCPIVAAK